MKKGLWIAAALAAAVLLSRLPNPARDVAKLKPVRAVYVFMEKDQLRIETDTEDSGAGATLSEAAKDLRAKADGEIFLDTAEFLLLDPAVQVTENFYDLLRPGCRVFVTEQPPDLKAAADYLSIHKPGTTLSHMRAESTERSRSWETPKNSIPSGS